MESEVVNQEIVVNQLKLFFLLQLGGCLSRQPKTGVAVVMLCVFKHDECSLLIAIQLIRTICMTIDELMNRQCKATTSCDGMWRLASVHVECVQVGIPFTR